MGHIFSDHAVIQTVYYLIVNDPNAPVFIAFYFEPLIVFFQNEVLCNKLMQYLTYHSFP